MSSFHRLILSCHYSETANSEDSNQFNSFAPKLISCKAEVSKLASTLHAVSLSLMLRPTASRPVCLEMKHPSGTYVQIFIIVWQLRVFLFGAPSLTRGRVCHLQLQLVLASTVIFGSESLSQIRDFPFRRLLRFAGSQWRYSTTPAHGYTLCCRKFL
jgi:uncharacterized membrane protein